jgi:hypothetical protein
MKRPVPIIKVGTLLSLTVRFTKRLIARAVGPAGGLGTTFSDRGAISRQGIAYSAPVDPGGAPSSTDASASSVTLYRALGVHGGKTTSQLVAFNYVIKLRKCWSIAARRHSLTSVRNP